MKVLASIVLAYAALGPGPRANATLIERAARADVRSVDTFCGLLLGEAPPAAISAELLAHAEFFRVARGAVPRLDGPDDSVVAREFTLMQNLAGRHGGRIVFTELVAGLDQITRVAARTLATLNPTDAALMRSAFEAAFAPQPGVFDFVRSRHCALEPLVRHEIAIWIGRAFVAEVERRAHGPRRTDLRWLYPPALAARLDARTYAQRDPQTARHAHGELGCALLAVYGSRGPDLVAAAGDAGEEHVARVQDLAPVDP